MGLIQEPRVVSADSGGDFFLSAYRAQRGFKKLKETKFSTDVRKHFFILQVTNAWDGLHSAFEVKDTGYSTMGRLATVNAHLLSSVFSYFLCCCECTVKQQFSLPNENQTSTNDAHEKAYGRKAGRKRSCKCCLGSNPCSSNPSYCKKIHGFIHFKCHSKN